MEQRYGVLRAIGALYQIAAVFALVGTLLLLLSDTFLVAKWVTLAAGLSTAIGAFATGKVIEVILTIEEHTRKSAMLLEQQAQPAMSAIPEQES